MTARTHLPVLYKEDSKGKWRFWAIAYKNDTVSVRYGATDGKEIHGEHTVKGKNIGRANETTDDEQARLECERDWTKKLDGGYAPDEDDEKGVAMYQRVMNVKKRDEGCNVNASKAVREPARKPSSRKKSQTEPLGYDGSSSEDEADQSSKSSTVKTNGKTASSSTVMKKKGKSASTSCDSNGKAEVTSKSSTTTKSSVTKGKKPLASALRANLTVPECREMHPLLAPSEVWKALPKQLKHFDFKKGVYVQPKLDGARALMFLVDGAVAITSRSGKQYPWLGHLREEVKLFLDAHPDVVLDGELYVHTAVDAEGNEKDANARFQFLQEMNKPRRGTPHAVEGQLEYHVFDVADPSKSQKERFKLLEELFDQDVASECSHIVQVDPLLVHDQEEAEKLGVAFAGEGYEGAILRAIDCPYTTKPRQRCLKMCKMKSFDEAEYTIVDVIRDEGKDECYFRYVCKLEPKEGALALDYETFNVTSMGTVESRRKLWRKRTSLIDKRLTVTYQGVSKDGVPRFPHGKGIRNDADDPR